MFFLLYITNQALSGALKRALTMNQLSGWFMVNTLKCYSVISRLLYAKKLAPQKMAQ